MIDNKTRREMKKDMSTKQTKSGPKTEQISLVEFIEKYHKPLTIFGVYLSASVVIMSIDLPGIAPLLSIYFSGASIIVAIEIYWKYEREKSSTLL